MDALLAAVPLEGVGVVGLCVFGVLAFARGWVYAGSVVAQLLKARDDRIAELVAERVDLKEAVRLKDEALRELSGQVSEMAELGRTSNALLRALAERSA